MKNRVVLFALVLAVQLAPLCASAQPIAHDIHHWYLETRWGVFEFRETEFLIGRTRYSYVTLGPLGTFDVNPNLPITMSLTTILAVAAIVTLTLVMWRGRRTKLSATRESLPLTSQKRCVQNK